MVSIIGLDVLYRQSSALFHALGSSITALLGLVLLKFIVVKQKIENNIGLCLVGYKYNFKRCTSKTLYPQALLPIIVIFLS